MEQKAMLAIDMGASNGRVVWGAWEKNRLVMRELHRFENVPIRSDGLMCWDIDRLLQEISTGLRKCAEAGLRFHSLGLCSWGNTVGVLDEVGQLLLPPLHYREQATDAALAGLYQLFNREALFARTLFVPMTIQPSVALRFLQARYPQEMQKARRVLMISDLFNYLLCGRACSERTMAATSGMLDMRTGTWDRELMEKIGLSRNWFPDIVESGTVLGSLKQAFAGYLGQEASPTVIAVAGHDTASAASVLPAGRLEDSLYLSCGTWSCMGCRVHKPVEGEAIFRSGATNDLGIFCEQHLRFNHTGLWVLQECRRYWNEHGDHFSHAALARLAAQSEAFFAFIDTEDARFFSGGDMPQKIQAYCQATGQKIPRSPGQTARVILESLALRYRYSSEVLSRLSGVRFNSMRILSGGARNELLCQMAADALCVRVYAGPSEASTIGNFIQQGISNGVLSGRDEACRILNAQGGIITYAPRDTARWDAQYAKALTLSGWGSSK